MAWFWVQLGVALLSVYTTVKAKREFKKQQKKLNKHRGFELNRFGQDQPLNFVMGERRVGATFVYRGTTDTDDYDNIPSERYASLQVWSIGQVNDVTDIKFSDQTADEWGMTKYWEFDGTPTVTAQEENDELIYTPIDSTAPNSQKEALTYHGLGSTITFINQPARDDLAQWDEFKKMVADDMTGVKFEGLTWGTYRVFLNRHNQKRYSSGEPTLTAKIKGPNILDPRTDTYVYSDNPIVQLYHYLKDSTIGKGLSDSDIDKQSFIDMANYCDELVTTPEGNRKRFTSNYVIDTSQTHQENIDDLKLGCHAELYDGEDGIRVDIDRPKTAVMHINEEEFVETVQSSIADINDRFNEVLVRYPDAEIDDKQNEVSFPDRSDPLYATWLAEDNNKELIDEVEVETVTDVYEAKRFAEYLAYKSRSSRSVSIAIGAKGLQLEPGDVITIDSTKRGWNAKEFIVQGIGLQTDKVSLELVEYDAQIYSYAAQSLRVAPPTPTLKDPFAIAPVTLLTHTENKNLSTISWTYPSNVFVTEFEVTLKQSGVTLKQVTSYVKDYDFSNLPAGNYDVEVVAKNNNAESTPENLSFTVSTPAQVTGLIVTDDYIEWQHANLSNVKEFVITVTANPSGEETVYTTEPMTGTQRLGVNGIKSGDYDVSVASVDHAGRTSTPVTLTNAQIDGATKGATIGTDLSGQFDSGGGNTDATNFFTTNAIKASIVDVESLLAETATITGTLKAGTTTTGNQPVLTVSDGIKINNSDGTPALLTEEGGGVTYSGGFSNGVITSPDVFTKEMRDLLINDVGSGGNGGYFEYSGLPYSLPTTTNPTGDLTVTISNGNDKDVTLSVTIKDSNFATGFNSNQNWTKPVYQVVFKRGTTTISTQTVEGSAANIQEPDGSTWEATFAIDKTVTFIDTAHTMTAGGTQAYNVVINRVSGESNAPKLTAYSASQQVVGGGGSSGGNADYATNAGYADNAGLLNGFADTAFIKSAANNTLSGDNTFSGNNTFTAVQNFSNGLQKGGVDVPNNDEAFTFLGNSNADADTFLNQDGYASGRPFVANHPPLGHGTMLNYGRSASGDIQFFVADNGEAAIRANSWDGIWSSWGTVAFKNKLTNFTVGLQVGGIDVLAKGDYGVGGYTADNGYATDFNLESDTGFISGNVSTTNRPFDYFDSVIVARDFDTRTILSFEANTNRVKVSSLNNGVWLSDVELALLEESQTFTGPKNFTGGLQKDSVTVLNQTENDARYLGISAKAADSDLLDGLDSTAYGRYAVAGTWTAQQTFTQTIITSFNGDVIQDELGNRILHDGGFVVLGNLVKNVRIDGAQVLMQDSTGSYTVAAIDKAQTFTAQQSFDDATFYRGTNIGADAYKDGFCTYAITDTTLDSGTLPSWVVVASFDGGSSVRGFELMASYDSVDDYYLRRRSDNANSENGAGLQNLKTIALLENTQTFTGQKNFTGGLLKNGTDVVSLGDLTVDSAATQALASVSMEQFEANKAAGLYDDYNTAEGSIAAGYINALTTQTNFLIAQGANIEKIKAGSIQLSGDGALTFADVGADQVGAAATAEANAKAHADTNDKTAGSIASWTLTATHFYSGTAQTTEGFSTNGITFDATGGGAIRAQNFRIESDGSAYFKGDITGASGTFSGTVQVGGTTLTTSNTLNSNTTKNDVGLGNVDNTSDATVLNSAATNANTAAKTAGSVGGWTIDSTAIYSGTKDTSGYTTNGITLNSAGSIHAKEFYIDTAGNANFKGNIDAASGTFNGTVYAENLEGDVYDADSKDISSLVISTGSGEEQYMSFQISANNKFQRRITFSPIGIRYSSGTSAVTVSATLYYSTLSTGTGTLIDSESVIVDSGSSYGRRGFFNLSGLLPQDSNTYYIKVFFEVTTATGGNVVLVESQKVLTSLFKKGSAFL